MCLKVCVHLTMALQTPQNITSAYFYNPMQSKDLKRSSEELDDILFMAEKTAILATDPFQGISLFNMKYKYYKDTLLLDDPVSENNPKNVKLLKPFYKKLLMKFGYSFRYDANTSIPSDFFANLYGKFEMLTHWESFGHSFQYAFTDPFFRLIDNGCNAWDSNLFSIHKFHENFSNHASAYSGENGEKKFSRTKKFFRLLFSNQSEQKPTDETYISAEDMKKWILTHTSNINYTFRNVIEKNSFLCFYLNLMYFIAYKAETYTDVEEYLKNFTFPEKETQSFSEKETQSFSGKENQKGNQSFKCFICGKTYTSKIVLDQHKKIHQ